MPNKSSKARGPRTNRRKSAPSKGNRRAPRANINNHHFMSIVIMTVQLKQAHKKEEVYPIPLGQLISRANVGQDADIRLIGYTMSVALATGNDCSTVSMNIGHEGPWIRRSDSTDTFNQVSTEHTVRGKSILFKKPLLAATEREYLNPDSSNNGLNSVDLRVRDPCGVIPGVVLKIEFRAHIIRRVPSTSFANADQPATDRYEDQDVSAGSSPSPSPPAAVKHAPQTITHATQFSGDKRYITDGLVHSGHFEYTTDDQYKVLKYLVSVTTPKQTVSGSYKFATDRPDQTAFNAAGFDGDITVHL